MKFIFVIIVFLISNNVDNATPIGRIRNISLVLLPSSIITINAANCLECLCAMLMNTGNFSIVSLNCYIQDINWVICQLFTMIDYDISLSYRIDINHNSTFYFLQLPFNKRSEITTAESTTNVVTTSTLTTSTTTTVRTLVNITRPGDPIVGLYNTTAGGSTGGKNGRFSTISEFPDKAIDQSTSTKYLNFGVTGGYGITAAAPGVGTGFYVTPTISNASVAVSLRFATADDAPKRDPITVTLEGTNSDLLDNGSSWTLLYNGSTGISLTTDPGRMTYVLAQNFSNTMAYKSYRLLITSQRDEEWAVQYSEAQIIGYVYLN